MFHLAEYNRSFIVPDFDNEVRKAAIKYNAEHPNGDVINIPGYSNFLAAQKKGPGE